MECTDLRGQASIEVRLHAAIWEYNHTNINAVIASILFSALIPISNSAESATIVEDSFETGDYSATNVEGFKWLDNAWTSIVSATERWEGESRFTTIHDTAAAPLIISENGRP